MRELFDLLVRSQIPVLVIGGHAVGAHGFQRNTADLDCLVVAERRDEMKTFLENRGFEETARNQNFSRYRHRSLAYPLLDVMQVDRNTWEKLWTHSVSKTADGYPVRVPSVEHLIALKLHAIQQNPARKLQDGNDIARLLRANPGAVSAAHLEEMFERYALPELFAMIKQSL